MFRRPTTARALALSLSAAGVVVMGGGVAAAETGSLPGAAQDTARTVLAKLGVSVPGSNSHANPHSDSRGDSSTAPSDQGSNGKGSEISGLATDPSTTGLDKGIAVSTAASGGKSQAGQHGGAQGGSDQTDGPESDGTGSDGAGSTGRTTAATASGGHAGAGAANAGTHAPR